MEVKEGHIVIARDDKGNPIATINKSMMILIIIGLFIGIAGAVFILFYLGGDIL